jgi:hypothetical protein
MCDVGTDCSDCQGAIPGTGIRVYHECEPGCFAFMVNDGVCQDQCNTHRCGFNDCTTVEAEHHCAQTMMADGLLLQPYSENPVVDATVSIVPQEISIDDIDQSTTMDATFMIRYADPRLFELRSNPCMKVLEHMVSISASEAADQMTLLRKLQDADSVMILPILQPKHKMRDLVVTERSFRLISKNSTVQDNIMADGGMAMNEAWQRLLDTPLDTLDDRLGQNLSFTDTTSSYVELSYRATIKVQQGHFDYLLYPFDAQTVQMHFDPGVNITTCGTDLFIKNSNHPMVTGSYIFGTPRVASMSSRYTSDGGCVIEIPGALARARRSKAPSRDSAVCARGFSMLASAPRPAPSLWRSGRLPSLRPLLTLTVDALPRWQSRASSRAT